MSLHQELFAELKILSTNKDRYIKGHSLALLARLQAINPQDE